MANDSMKHRLRFGVITSGRPRLICMSVDDMSPHKDVDWSQAIIPSDYQDEGSCVARATCNLIECLLRIRSGAAVIPSRLQLDAEALYWAARKRFYGDTEDLGLQLKEALQVAIEDFGILPPDTNIIEVEPNLASIVAALHISPMIQAHLVGENWTRGSVDTINGGIPYATVNPFNAIGGHATLMTGYRYRSGKHLLQLQNSWSSWGWHSQGIMEWDTWWAGFKWVMDGPYMVQLSDKWKTWDGWKQHIKK